MASPPPGPRGLIVRPASTPDDWRAVEDLCRATGDGGRPIAPARGPLFADVWIGPYRRLRPGWTLVAETEGRVVGYLTGCPDTRRFLREARLRVALPLVARVLAGRHAWTVDARRLVRRTLGLDRGPEGRLRRRLPPGFLDAYPAHLHVNVDAGARARGVGRALVEAYLAALGARGVAGVHLFCGAGPLGFYRRLGFAELGRLEVRPGVWVHALGRRPALPGVSPSGSPGAGSP